MERERERERMSSFTGNRNREKVFYVYLISNASTDLAKNNTLTHYRNYLAETLFLPQKENWYVCLNSLYLSNSSTPGTDKNTVLNVVCPQISQTVGFNHSLSIHARSRLSLLHIYEPNVKHYFRPLNEYISYLDIEISSLDPQKNLNLTVNQPTIVVLEFLKMSPNRVVHAIKVCNESAEDSIFNTRNTSTNFKVRMPRELSSTNTSAKPIWEMCLSSITFESKFDQESPKLPNQSYKIFFIKTAKQKKQRRKKKRKKIRFAAAANEEQAAGGGDERGSSQQQLVDNIILTGSEEEEEEEEEELVENDIIRQRNKRSLDASPVIQDIRFSLYVKRQYETNKQLWSDFIKICLETTGLMGYEGVNITVLHGKLNLDCVDAAYNLTIAMPKYLANMLGFPSNLERFWKSDDHVELLIPAGSQYTCPLPIDIYANIPKNMLIYVNCIESSLMGNIFSPILKSVPITRKMMKTSALFHTYESKHMEFHKVAYSSLDFLHFKALRVDGQEIDVYDKIKIYIGLLFRFKK